MSYGSSIVQDISNTLVQTQTSFIWLTGIFGDEIFLHQEQEDLNLLQILFLRTIAMFHY